MIKRIISFLTSVGLLFFVVTPLFAQDAEGLIIEDISPQDRVESVIAPEPYPIPGPEPGFIGQDHNYTVVFRGNGEAVVTLRVAFTNKDTKPVNTLNLRIPRVSPRELSVYQVIKQGRCVRYTQGVYNPISRTYGQRVCAEYSNPDYYTAYYGDAKYQKANASVDIDTLKIVLPQSVAANGQGAFFIYFRASGYAKKDIFGAYKYTFETLKAEDNIRNLRVGISTDSDLVLKGVKGEISYRFEDAAVESFGAAGVAAPLKSAEFDRFYNQIGQGRVTKSASNLAPLESYTVTGAYASSRAKLYAKETTITLLVIAIIIAIAVLLIRVIIKKLRKVTPKREGADKSDKVDSSVKTLQDNTRTFFVALGVSFISSIMMLGYSVFLFVFSSIVDRLISYQYEMMFGLFTIIISIVVYVLLLFGPGVYIGAKKGIGWGLGTIILGVMWLIIYFFIAVFVVFMFSVNTRGVPITPLF